MARRRGFARRPQRSCYERGRTRDTGATGPATAKQNMVPSQLKLSNFTSYGTDVPELDFTKFHMAAISGSNGAGKSSLLDAVTWCLWGTSRLGDAADQLIHLGQTVMFVEFSFELDGHEFTVKRQRLLKAGGSTALEFLSGSHNLTEGTIKTTQQKIIDTLHLTYETFTNSAFLRQGHADEFTTKGPTDRKRILADILGLSHYDVLEGKAKEKIKEIQVQLQLLEYQTLEVEAELSQKEERSQKKKVAEEKIKEIDEQIRNLEEKLKGLQGQKEALNLASGNRNKLEENYLENSKELEEILSQGKSRKEKIDALAKQLEKLKGVEEELKKLKSLQAEKEKMDELIQKRLETERNFSEVSGQMNLKKQQATKLKQEIEKLQGQLLEAKKPGAKCPTCGQEIGKEDKIHVHKSLSDQVNSLQKELSKIDYSREEKEIKKLGETIKSLTFDPDKYQLLSSQLLDLEKLQQQKEAMLQIQATLQTEQKVVLEMRTLFKSKKDQVDKLAEEIRKLPDLSEKLAETAKEINEAENQLNTIRSEEREARGILGQITELISRTAHLEKVQAQQKEKKLNLQKEKEAFEDLALAFGKKGIQAMIIETAIPEIEEEANRLLEKLTEGRMRVYLETQRETKTLRQVSGQAKAPGIIETLDIIISDEMGERPYESFSGGEAFRINFAIRLALSKLLTHRAGAKLQLLVIDEGFGTQDAEGRSRIVEAINAIKNDFEKILIITHLEELKEEFPVRIEVNKGPTGSTFEVVGA